MGLKKALLSGISILVLLCIPPVINQNALGDATIATIILPGANAIAYDSNNGYLYVTTGGGVSIMDGSTNTLIGSPITTGAVPVAIAFDSANGNLYVVNKDPFGNSGTVSVINGTTNKIVGSPIPVGVQPVAIAFDSANGNLYIVNSDPSGSDRTVSVIDGRTNTVIGSPIPIGASMISSIAFDSANGNLYVGGIFITPEPDGYVLAYGGAAVIDGTTNTVIGSPIPVGVQPVAIAFDSANGNLYVEGFDPTSAGFVTPVNGTTNTMIGSPIPIGPIFLQGAIAYNPSNGKLYAANFGNGSPVGNTISVIDGATNKVVGDPIVVGKGPNGIAFDSANKNLYVTASDGTVSVISTSVPSNPPSEKPILQINSVDQNNKPVSGIWITIQTDDGNQVWSGFTPATFTGNPGVPYRVTMADYDGKVFKHWGDGDISNVRRVALPITGTTTITASYDTGNSLRGFSPLRYTGTAEQPDLTVNARLLDDSKDLQMWMAIDPLQTNSTGTTYKVFATDGYQNLTFDHWGDNGSNDRIRTLTVDKATTITAYYRTD